MPKGTIYIPYIYSTETLKEGMVLSTRSAIEYFSACCMFDVFLAVLRLDCVGTSDTADLILVYTEVCKQIHHLCQSFKDKHGRFVQNSPNKNICQYMSLITDLPDDTTGRTMQLSRALFSALDKDIQDILADCIYTLPILSGHPTEI